jgi:site-specific DNA-adenine methylase
LRSAICAFEPDVELRELYAEGFTAFDQRRLQQKVVAACKRGAFVVVSNSSAAEILSAYTTLDAQKVGLQVRPVPARRSINSKASSRGRSTS